VSDAALDPKMQSVEKMSEESTGLIRKYLKDNHEELCWSIIPALHEQYCRWLHAQGEGHGKPVSLYGFEEYVVTNDLIFKSDNNTPQSSSAPTAVPKLLMLASGRSVQSPESWATMYPMAQYLRLFRGKVTREKITTRYVHLVKWMREDLYRSPFQVMPEPPTKTEFLDYAQDTGFGEDS
jgi:hypothetical protein